MITIEELKRVSVNMMALNEYRSTVSYLEVVMFAISQHEELEKLHAANKDALAWFEDLKVEFDKVRRERDEAYERAAQVCEAVSCYDNYDASETFAKAVRELKGLGSGSYCDTMQPDPGEPK